MSQKMMKKEQLNLLIICGGIGILLLLVAIIFQGDIRNAIENIRRNIEQAKNEREQAQWGKAWVKAQEIQEQQQAAIRQRTAKLINLLDAFPGCYQVRLLGFQKQLQGKSAVFTVDYQVGIDPAEYGKYLKRFNEELSELDFNSSNRAGSLAVQIIYGGPEGGIDTRYAPQSEFSMPMLNSHYRPNNQYRQLVCRFDFLNKNGQTLLSRNVVLGAPIYGMHETPGKFDIYPPDYETLSRQARMRFNLSNEFTQNAIVNVKLSLQYGVVPEGALRETREAIQ